MAATVAGELAVPRLVAGFGCRVLLAAGLAVVPGLPGREPAEEPPVGILTGCAPRPCAGAFGFGLLAARTGYPPAFAVTALLVLSALVPLWRDRTAPGPR